MTLLVCLNCTTKFSVGAPWCPGCTSTRFVPEEDAEMPKTSALGVTNEGVAREPEAETPRVLPVSHWRDPSDGTAPATAPATDPEPEALEVPADPEPEPEIKEESSPDPGTASSTSSGSAEPSDSTSEPASPPPAPSAASPSPKGKRASSSAATTDGPTPATT